MLFYYCYIYICTIFSISTLYLSICIIFFYSGDSYRDIMVDTLADQPYNNNTTNNNSNSNSNSNMKLCGACGIGYTMFRREHRCRLCCISCCDDCSKKRVTMVGLPVCICIYVYICIYMCVYVYIYVYV